MHFFCATFGCFLTYLYLCTHERDDEKAYFFRSAIGSVFANADFVVHSCAPFCPSARKGVRGMCAPHSPFRAHRRADHMLFWLCALPVPQPAFSDGGSRDFHSTSSLFHHFLQYQEATHRQRHWRNHMPESTSLSSLNTISFCFYLRSILTIWK